MRRGFDFPVGLLGQRAGGGQPLQREAVCGGRGLRPQHQPSGRRQAGRDPVLQLGAGGGVPGRDPGRQGVIRFRLEPGDARGHDQHRGRHLRG